MNKKLETIAELKEELVNAFSDKIGENPPEQVGYIEPGHGAKGKQRWLNNGEDLNDMYDIHSSSQEVMLWTYFQNHDSVSETSKRPRSAEDDNTSGAPATKVTRSEAISDKLKEVDEIVQQLSSKHEATGNYTLEQLRTWAHLIQMKKHTSIDVPPDKPFFGQSFKRKSSHGNTTSTSPLKVISMRGDCIDQLKKAHDLFDIGAITKEQYDDLQKNIFDDLNGMRK